ncbi:MAG: hypothetical protein JST54_30790 [Deltaproteobacteria bacterium]|nr:hypothetical protein [Deltaproteobacteria bacterium]
MSLEAHLARFGLQITPEDADDIRAILHQQVQAERASQGDGDTELMRLCCVQLFGLGQLDDVLRIWEAKTASFDTFGGFDMEYLLGAGLDATKRFLAGHGSSEAQRALARIAECERAGNFDGYSPAKQMTFYERYYRVSST